MVCSASRPIRRVHRRTHALDQKGVNEDSCYGNNTAGGVGGGFVPEPWTILNKDGDCKHCHELELIFVIINLEGKKTTFFLLSSFH